MKRGPCHFLSSDYFLWGAYLCTNQYQCQDQYQHQYQDWDWYWYMLTVNSMGRTAARYM